MGLLSKVYINLIDQKETTLDFKNKDEQPNLDVNNELAYYKKIVKPDSNEIEKHNEYLGKD